MSAFSRYNISFLQKKSLKSKNRAFQPLGVGISTFAEKANGQTQKNVAFWRYRYIIKINKDGFSVRQN